MNRMKHVVKSLVVMAALFLAVGSVNAQQKIGHVNYAEIFTATPEYQRAENELRGLDSVKTEELQGMFGVFQQKQGEAQELLRNRSEANREAVDTQLEVLDAELQDFQRRLQESQQLAEQELTQKQQELFAPIHQKVTNAIQAVAREQGYAYLFDISSTNIPFFEGGDDKSADVKTQLGITSTN